MADTTKSNKTCFVVGPIGASGSSARIHADWLLQGIIEPVFEEHFPDVEVERADKITSPGMIDSQVITRLLDAELVIADMSLLNANAFYEMGIRHMAQKPIIHMFLEGSEIPFDVKPYRAIPFSLMHPNDLKNAQKHLKDAIANALADNYVVENPVTRARGQVQLEQHATPGQRVMLDEIIALRERVAAVEASQTTQLPSQRNNIGRPVTSWRGNYRSSGDGWQLLVGVDPKANVDEDALLRQIRPLIGAGAVQRIDEGALVFSFPTSVSDHLVDAVKTRLGSTEGVNSVAFLQGST